MGPQQYAAIGDTVGKGIGNMIDRKSNKEQLAIERQGLEDQSEYIGNQSNSMRDTYDAKMDPYVTAGQDSLGKLTSTDTNVNSYDAPMGTRDDYGFEMGDFETDPGYEFRKAEGSEALSQSASGNGSLYSSGAEKDQIEFGQNLASEEYQNVYDRKFAEYQDANSEFKDARDYNTNLDSSNLDRGISLNQNLNNQGYDANMSNANTELGITQDETAFEVDNMGQLSNNAGAKLANKYGFASDQNQIASDGFQKFMGGSSFGG